MVVTEEMLAPHRKNGTPITLGRHKQSLYDRLPNLFTATDKVFQSDWSNHRSPGSSSVLVERLEVVLVLAFARSVPVLLPDRKWVGLSHQCGGYSNTGEIMIATRLTPRASVLPTLQTIAREGFFAENGHFDSGQVLASRIASYIAALGQIGVDCESTWRYLTESLYPIDATQENLTRLAEDAPDLATIANWSGFIRARYANDPVIFFMTENSD
jgi:hypothetical protein